MKNYIYLVMSLILVVSTANAAPMAPWSRAAMPFSQVLEILNENGLIVASLVYDKKQSGAQIINATVKCTSRKSAILVFDVDNLPEGTEVLLTSDLSKTCL